MRGRRGHSLLASSGVACALLAATAAPGQVVKKAAPSPADRQDELVKKTLDAIRVELGQQVRGRGAPAPPPAPAPAVLMRQVLVQQPFPNQNLIQQFTQQYRPILRSEYQFLVTVCEPTRGERKLIARAGEEALKVAATKVAEWQQGRRNQAGGGVAEVPSPQTIVVDGLTAAVKAHLSPAQAARFEAEVAQKRESLKKACVSNFVAKLDQSLYLSADQRDKLGGSLSANWNDSWFPSLQVFQYETNYLPQVPDRHVVPFLNAAQRKIWDATPKVQQSFWGGGGMEAAPLEDAELDEPPPQP